MEPHAPIITLKQLAGNAPTHLYPLQTLLSPHVHSLVMLWFGIWLATGTVLLFNLVREYAAHRRDRIV